MLSTTLWGETEMPTWSATLLGATEPVEPPAVTLLAVPVPDYNTHALSSSGPRIKAPKPGPVRSHSVNKPFEANDAGTTSLPKVDASRYNQHVLKSSDPIVEYPY